MSKTKNTKKTKSSNANQTTKISHILLIMIAVTAVLIVATVYGLRRYENGILDVCATQQDSYVQLVIDQINLKENRTDQEIIENILSTLDSSSNRYWTFSKSQTMLYVKDALETNKYQSLTANSYYQSDTAKAFVDHLLQNKVTHSEIEIDGKKYIASGVLFEYGGENYRICLLTNRTVLLDNNAFLGAKMELILLFVLSYAAIFILPIVLVMLRNYLILKEQATRADLDDMSQKVMALNERLTTTELYDNRKNLFQLATVERFVEELKGEKKAYPISFLAFRYPQDSTVANFFGGNCLALGSRDIKFYDGRLHLALILCVGCDASQARNLSAKIRPKNTLLGSHTAMDGSHLSMAYEAIFRDMGDPDIHAQPAARVERPDSRTESRYRSKENGSQNVQQTPPVRETKPEEKKTGASVQEIKPATQEMKPAVKPVVPEAKTAVQENPPAVKEAPVQRAET
ncbi:MAG: hypothetical protein IJT34_04040, partial [Butyrivibrio sp.]|nr:hypothetical protein [Butyrivibrio sp.]